MQIKEGTSIKWRYPSGAVGKATVRKHLGYINSNAHGKSIDFSSETGFHTVALDWITHIGRKKVQRREGNK